MLRFINIILLILIGVLTVFLYQLKYEARQLDRRAKELVQQISDERDTISVLKAEWSLLTEPERIQKLAKQHLGLKTINPKQIVTHDWLNNLPEKKETSLRHNGADFRASHKTE